MVKKTAKGGSVNFKSLIDGTYNGIDWKSGFKEVNTTVKHSLKPRLIAWRY